MGRNKYSQSEFDAIARLLSLKGSANRAKQKAMKQWEDWEAQEIAKIDK